MRKTFTRVAIAGLALTALPFTVAAGGGCGGDNVASADAPFTMTVPSPAFGESTTIDVVVDGGGTTVSEMTWDLFLSDYDMYVGVNGVEDEEDFQGARFAVFAQEAREASTKAVGDCDVLNIRIVNFAGQPGNDIALTVNVG